MLYNENTFKFTNANAMHLHSHLHFSHLHLFELWHMPFEFAFELQLIFDTKAFQMQPNQEHNIIHMWI